MSPETDKPWEILNDLIEKKQTSEILEFLESCSSHDTALILSRLPEDERSWLMNLLEPSFAAELIDDVPDIQAASILSELSPSQAASIVDELALDHQADLLAELKTGEAEQILQNMSPENANSLRRTLSYPKDTAGGLMIFDFLSYRMDMKIREVHLDLQARQDTYSRYHVQYIYVTDADDRLTGVMRIHDLLFSNPEAIVRDVMIPHPHHLPELAGLAAMTEAFDQYHLLALPVVDDTQRLLGIVLPFAVEEARRKNSVKHFLWLSGIIGGEEFRSMPFFKRSGRRLSWLSLNIVLNILAASVIALYQDTLAAAIALAVFLPMVSDMSGCSGNQAVAVSLRELSVGLLRPSEILRVAFKESMLGLVNGLILGLLLGVVSYLWKGNVFLSLVVGAALAGNTIVAVTVGGSLPLLLKKFRVDPALVSSPVLTTITDMCGFFLVLSLAGLFLPYLTAV